MAKGTSGCRNPKIRTKRPQRCAPAQIKKCHGNVKKHPCAKKDRPEIGY